ncbi:MULTISPECIES: DUF6292 family protein [Amycolatopsis methanolica group]|uniref:DUF6292 domain-containing protein n=2 Tax=Amycolatopsis methanolica group TaxID=2893674 RepID=A0A076MTR5_AMYME|nr:MULTISPECIES: DUF6292 family protein [Amycolatopsis methanolica group]AIJ22311.1 hypothetical protein AMETH_2219 [Amycolatopsis methanolica 239]ROS38815.1 hypothetical protein EDD35_1103 [Amycolatopsis thermoflava]
MDSPAAGLTELSRGLAGYLRAVAEAVGVPAEATSFELSDTATAYLGLTRRWPTRPGEDLMLVWSEGSGWAVAVETGPGETPMVLAWFAGDDVVPEPADVARFVTGVIAADRSDAPRPVFAVDVGRNELAARLARYVEP